MRPYLESYFDLYWDLHLGVKPDAVPPQVQIGEAFNTVLAYRDPTQKIVYDNYMMVRANLAFLKEWIDDRLADIKSGKTPNPEKTFAYYWIKNAGNGEYFAHKDVVFEVFHNFVALSQWGNTMYNIMLKLAKDTGDPDTRAWFKKTMEGNPDDAGGKAFTPLERFVMELFRTITPNGGSISAMAEVRTPPYERHGYVVSPHKSTSFDPVQWKDPEKFNPDRYKSAPTSHDINEDKCDQIGFAKCPFSTGVRGGGRAQGSDQQQRFRHRLRHRRRQAAAGLRLCGLCAFRLRLSPLPRRAAHHPSVRGFSAQSLEERNRVPKARHRQSRAAAHRADHGHRRQCRLHAICFCLSRPNFHSAQAGTRKETSMKYPRHC